MKRTTFWTVCILVAAASMADGGTITVITNCEATSNPLDCNLANVGGPGGDPQNFSGTVGTTGAQEAVTESADADYGELHASTSSSLTIGSSPTILYGIAGAGFADSLTISNPLLTGQTGYLQVGYTLDGSISSSGGNDGSILTVGNVGSTYSANVYTSSVEGSFVFPVTYTFTYGTSFNLGVSLYTAVGTGTWIAEPSFFFGFDYGFAPESSVSGTAVSDASNTLILSLLQVEDSSGVPVSGATFSAASGLDYSPNGIVPEPSTLVLVALPLCVLLRRRFAR